MNTPAPKVMVALGDSTQCVDIARDTTANAVIKRLYELKLWPLPPQIQTPSLAGAVVPPDIPLSRLCKCRRSDGGFSWMDKNVVPHKQRKEAFLHCAQYCTATIETRSCDLTRAVARKQIFISRILKENNLHHIPEDEILAEAWFTTGFYLPPLDITDAQFKRYQARFGIL